MPLLLLLALTEDASSAAPRRSPEAAAAPSATAVLPPPPLPPPFLLPADALAIPRGTSRLRVFGDGDGLRNLVIVSITQDAQGALWLGTDDGVYRYDGERFTLFGLEQGLPSTTTLVVGLGLDGQACSGSKQGLVCWDGHRFSRAGAVGLPLTSIYSIVTRRHRMWVGTDRGLFVREGEAPFRPAPGWPTSPPSPAVEALWIDDRGVIAGVGSTVLVGDGDGAWQELRDIGLAGDRIDGVLRDGGGAIWIRTAFHLWQLPPGQRRAVDLGAGLPPAFDSSDVAINMILGLHGQVWIGTDTGIAYRDGDHWQLLGPDLGFPGARTLFIDHEDTVWMGSNGLYRWRGRGLIERHDFDTGLPGKVAWSFGRDALGALWIGTEQCLARMLDDAWHCLAGTEGHVVRGFAFPPQGGVFLGGQPAELLYIDPLGAITRLGDELRAPLDQKIFDLALGPEGDLWLATRAGLYRLPGAVPGPLVPVPVPGLSAQASFASLLVDGSRLWAASTEGLVLIEGGDPRQVRVFHAAHGFRVNAMRYLTSLHDRRVCVAYGEAIGFTCFAFDGRHLSGLRHYDAGSGLTSAKIYFLGEDRWQRLWVGTGDGVDVITAQGVEHFSQRDGLAGNDSTANAFFSDGDGSLWMGAVGGASHVLAAEYHGPPPPPRSVVRGGRLGGHPLPAGATALAAALETEHDRSALTLDFGSDSLADPDRIELQVRLSPLEKQWSTTTLRQARYPALLPGQYRGEIRARVDKGAWGEPVELRFVVHPAWWQTRWFLGLLGLAVLGGIGGLSSWRQRALLRQRTRQLDEQASVRLRTLLDSMPDLIIVHRDEQVIYLNHTARKLFGVEVSPDAARRLCARFHPQDVAKVTSLSSRSRDFDANRAPEMLEVRARGADDNWRTLELTSVRIDFGGAPANVVAARDVTERRRLRDKLVVSDRMASLGTLAAGIAHEINNPLSYVIGNLQLVAETLGEAQDPDVVAAIADANDGAERVRKIVSGLRAFSRSEEEQRLAIDLRGALEAALRLTANEVKHRARLVTELGEVPHVIGDDGRLTQVFINLLVNAAQAITAGKSDEHRITARTFTDAAGRAVVEISDTGAGMTPEVLARVFDPFFTTKDVGEGTGLGLSICHGIIEGLGGQISIDSAPGRGTTVRVTIPAIDVPAAEPAPAAAAVAIPPAQRHHVMVVDDEPLVVEMLSRALRRDHEITVESCGRDALRRIAGGARFDAIVSDVMMPNMTGIELLEELMRIAPDQARRLIFLSGGAFSAQTRVRLDELGAPQLAKPVDTNELRSCVLRVVTSAEGSGGVASKEGPELAVG